MTEAGWTSNRPKVAGWYWFRVAEIATPKPLYVDYGFVNGKQVWYAEGCAGYIHDWPHGEWLGPITPDSYQQGRVASCEWTYDEMDDYYETACKNAYCLADGTLKDNDHKYCPYCGGLIQLAQQAQDEKGGGDEPRRIPSY